MKFLTLVTTKGVALTYQPLYHFIRKGCVLKDKTGKLHTVASAVPNDSVKATGRVLEVISDH